MSIENEHLVALLALPVADRARAARTLLESLDESGDDDSGEPPVAQAQLAELTRRMQALDDGAVSFVNHADARIRVMARLQAIRGR